MQERHREVLREASVVLQGRTVTLWEVSQRADVVPVLTSAIGPRYDDTALDLDGTLLRCSAPIIHGSRWVGCRLVDRVWGLAPARSQPPSPLPGDDLRRT